MYFGPIILNNGLVKVKAIISSSARCKFVAKIIFLKRFIL